MSLDPTTNPMFTKPSTRARGHSHRSQLVTAAPLRDDSFLLFDLSDNATALAFTSRYPGILEQLKVARTASLHAQYQGGTMVGAVAVTTAGTITWSTNSGKTSGYTQCAERGAVRQLEKTEQLARIILHGSQNKPGLSPCQECRAMLQSMVLKGSASLETLIFINHERGKKAGEVFVTTLGALIPFTRETKSGFDEGLLRIPEHARLHQVQELTHDGELLVREAINALRASRSNQLGAAFYDLDGELRSGGGRTLSDTLKPSLTDTLFQAARLASKGHPQAICLVQRVLEPEQLFTLSPRDANEILSQGQRGGIDPTVLLVTIIGKQIHSVVSSPASELFPAGAGLYDGRKPKQLAHLDANNHWGGERLSKRTPINQHQMFIERPLIQRLDS